MPHRVSPTERIHGHIDGLFASGRQLPEIMEEVARLGAQLLMQAALEAEISEFLGRGRYQRAAASGDARPGSRNGPPLATASSSAAATPRRWNDSAWPGTTPTQCGHDTGARPPTKTDSAWPTATPPYWARTELPAVMSGPGERVPGGVSPGPGPAREGPAAPRSRGSPQRRSRRQTR